MLFIHGYRDSLSLAVAQGECQSDVIPCLICRLRLIRVICDMVLLHLTSVFFQDQHSFQAIWIIITGRTCVSCAVTKRRVCIIKRWRVKDAKDSSGGRFNRISCTNANSMAIVMFPDRIRKTCVGIAGGRNVCRLEWPKIVSYNYFVTIFI